MNKQNSTKLKKKEVKTSLIQCIEQTLLAFDNDAALYKVRSTVKKAAEKITKRYLRKVEKETAKTNKEAAKESKKNALTRSNKNYTKKLKGKPGKENVKEALKL